MVKTVDARANRPDTHAPPRAQLREKQPQRFCSELDQKCVQFFQFLKEWQSTQRGQEGAGRGREGLLEVGEQLMTFFNGCGQYSQGELESHVVCLANLFNVLGDDIYQLRFERHFRTKLRSFATHLAHAPPTPNRTPKLQALLYVLVVLIYRERVATSPTLPAVTRGLLGDRVLVGSLLSLRLAGDKKTSKFYGIVMVYLASKSNSKKVKEQLVGSILRNLGRVEHQPSRVNLIAYLRAEKNKVKLNFKDVVQGGVFPLLLAAHPLQPSPLLAHALLDYLLHLLLLFPALASQLPPHFLPALLQTAPLPAHQPTVAGLLHAALKYLEPTPKALLLEQLMQIGASDPFLVLQLAQVLLEHAQIHAQTIQLTQRGYFEPLLDLVHPRTPAPQLSQAALLYAQLVSQVGRLNADLCRCLLRRLSMQLQSVEAAQAKAVVREVRERMKESPF